MPRFLRLHLWKPPTFSALSGPIIFCRLSSSSLAVAIGLQCSSVNKLAVFSACVQNLHLVNLVLWKPHISSAIISSHHLLRYWLLASFLYGLAAITKYIHTVDLTHKYMLIHCSPSYGHFAGRPSRTFTHRPITYGLTAFLLAFPLSIKCPLARRRA